MSSVRVRNLSCRTSRRAGVASPPRHQGGHHDQRPRRTRPPHAARPPDLVVGPGSTWEAARDDASWSARRFPHPRRVDALACGLVAGPPMAGAATSGRSRSSLAPHPGPVPFLDLFQGVATSSDLPAHVATTAHPPGAVRGPIDRLAPQGRRYLNARGVRGIVTTGRPGRGGHLRRVHGLHPALVLPSAMSPAPPIGGDMGHLVSFLRAGTGRSCS